MTVIIKPKTKPKKVKPPSRIKPNDGPPQPVGPPLQINSGGSAGGSTSDPRGGATSADRPPTTISDAPRVGGGYNTTVEQGAPPSFEDRVRLSGGGSASGTNPLTSGTVESGLQSQDMEAILHGAKRKGRVKRERGTE